MNRWWRAMAGRVFGRPPGENRSLSREEELEVLRRQTEERRRRVERLEIESAVAQHRPARRWDDL